MKTFFAPITSVNYEELYWSIWNQIYLLKEYCDLSLDEQRMMTAEERSWYLRRHNEEVQKRNEQERRSYNKSHSSGISKPSVRR